MRDDVFPLAGAGVALVVFLDPVRLEDDAVVRAHEIVRQAKRVQRLADERVNGGGIVVMLDAAKGGDAGGIGLSVGVHSFFSANRAARIFSPNTRRVKCRRNRSRSPASSVRPRKPSSRSAIWPGDFVSTSPS